MISSNAKFDFNNLATLVPFIYMYGSSSLPTDQRPGTGKAKSVFHNFTSAEVCLNTVNCAIIQMPKILYIVNYAVPGGGGHSTLVWIGMSVPKWRSQELILFYFIIIIISFFFFFFCESKVY